VSLLVKWKILIDGIEAAQCTEDSRVGLEAAYRKLFPKSKIETVNIVADRIRQAKLKEKED